jgi:hypothetical protein
MVSDSISFSRSSPTSAPMVKPKMNWVSTPSALLEAFALAATVGGGFLCAFPLDGARHERRERQHRHSNDRDPFPCIHVPDVTSSSD